MTTNSIQQYLGAIHIHSKHSDGTGDINSISKAAKKAGLDWIIITDHNNLDIEEGFYNGVCVIKGEEISPSQSNHYIALGIKNLINPNDDIQKIVDEVRIQNGFGFAAHPDEKDNRKHKNLPIKWTNKSIIPDGIEIWNWFSDWADNYDESNIFTIAYSYFFRHKLILGPNKDTLLWWDKLNKEKKEIVPAIGGCDAHALKISKYILPITIFPYECHFKSLNNIINLKDSLPEDFQKSKNLILKAIKQGQNIIINRQISSIIPKIHINNGIKSVSCGEKIELTPNTVLNITLKGNCRIKIILDGEEIHNTTNTNNLSLKLSKKGKYRIEGFFKNQPYFYSNPIIVN